MPYDDFLADKIRQSLQSRGAPFYDKKMMGGLIFMVDDKMCIGLDQDRKTGESRLMARVGKEAYEGLLNEEGVRKMDFTGRPMPGFIFVYPEGFDLDEDLEKWIDRAMAFNPLAKKSKKRK